MFSNAEPSICVGVVADHSVCFGADESKLRSFCLPDTFGTGYYKKNTPPYEVVE